MRIINAISIRNKIAPIFVLLVIALIAPAFSNVLPQNNAGEYDDGKFVSIADRFEIYLPVNPKLIKTKTQGLLVKCYESATDDAVFDVFVHEYKWDELSKEAIDAYLTTLMKTSLNVWENAEILYSKRSILNGRPILDFRASIQQYDRQLIKFSRIIMGKERTYALTVLCLEENADKIIDSFILFLDSFNILDERYKLDRYYDKGGGL